jgi:hypothetical protein
MNTREEVYPMSTRAEKDLRDIEVSPGLINLNELGKVCPSAMFEFIKEQMNNYLSEAEHAGFGDERLTQAQVDIMVDFAIYFACVINDMRESD